MKPGREGKVTLVLLAVQYLLYVAVEKVHSLAHPVVAPLFSALDGLGKWRRNV